MEPRTTESLWTQGKRFACDHQERWPCTIGLLLAEPPESFGSGTSTQCSYITGLRTVRLGLAFDALGVGGQVALSKPSDTQGLLPTMELFPGSSVILNILFSHQE